MTNETDLLPLLSQSMNETEITTWILPSNLSTTSDINWIGTNTANIEGEIYNAVGLELDKSNELKAFNANTSDFFASTIFGIAEQPKSDPNFNVSNPPDPPNVVSKDSTSVTLSWNPPPNSNNPILGYYLEYRAANGTWKRANNNNIINVTNYKVAGLKPAEFYEFRVIAENSYGLSNPSESSGHVDLNANDDQTTNEKINSEKTESSSNNRRIIEESSSSPSRVLIWLIQTLGCVFLLSILGFSICANLYFK